ncbi:MAG TPA: type II secretion system major pseudopilin GspG [Sedimentisphaerales bacterium]|nr:type II secretion system major pseudopilin GspG [Sedimentisphaerales bacterium]
MKKKSRHLKEGFTMVELMAILVIIGLLAAVVATNVIGKIDKAKVVSTKTSLRVLHAAVTQFKLDTGRYPDEQEGLEVLIVPPTDAVGWDPSGYLETTEVPKDAWGNDFDYILNPESGKPFVVISYGADGEQDGEGYDADLYSTDAY